MSLEKIKREFIRWMEEVHGGVPYPRNIYGCLLAIMVEPEPVSQERIMELTGFSQATVSLTIQKIQLLFPIRTIKKVKERKHYYEYDAPYRFSLDLTKRRTEVRDLDTGFIEPILEKARLRMKKEPSLRRFVDYLNNLLLYLNLTHEIRTNNAKVFEQAMEDGMLDNKKVLSIDALNRKPLSDFLLQLQVASNGYEHSLITKEPSSSNLKREYLTGAKSNFNPLYSQALANQYLVAHTVILEGTTTQEQIEHLTQLPRSTISEVLSLMEKRGVAKVMKKKGSRVKYYQPGVLFSQLMLGQFDRTAMYIEGMKNRLTEFVVKTRKIRSSKKSKKLLEILESLERAYSFALALSHDMKVRMVMSLKEEYDRGFGFI
jgi:DNA-binding transcriptional regulator GbsR (MarR family)